MKHSVHVVHISKLIYFTTDLFYKHSLLLVAIIIIIIITRLNCTEISKYHNNIAPKSTVNYLRRNTQKCRVKGKVKAIPVTGRESP
jgi:hypothetical protein